MIKHMGYCLPRNLPKPWSIALFGVWSHGLPWMSAHTADGFQPLRGWADIGWSKAPTINHIVNIHYLFLTKTPDKQRHFHHMGHCKDSEVTSQEPGAKNNSLSLDNVNPLLHRYIRLPFTKYNLFCFVLFLQNTI